MKILSKTEFNQAVTESLFNPGGTLALLPKERFNLGKYRKSVIGRDLSAVYDTKHLRIVWAEARSDKDGPYYALYCIPNRAPSLAVA
jgi:hypothetical protein